MKKDPVCGMQVDENSQHKSQYQGQTYYFCSANCQRQFDQNPQRYAKTGAERKTA